MKYLLIALIFCSCTEIKKPHVVSGKDVSSDKFGNQSHYLYYNGGSKSVTGYDYYSTKVGDTIYVTEVKIGN